MEPGARDPFAPGRPGADIFAGGEAGSLPRLGSFVLKERIGTGGMGEVFLARRDGEDEDIALKVLNPVRAEDKEFVTRFRREAQFMLQLDHPNIVKAYEVGTVGNRHYLCMEYVPGQNLRERMVDEKCIAPVEAMKIMRQVADALDYGSRRGVVHRDLKPENILVRPDGVAKLADMGLAILAHRKDMRLTAPGLAMGTPFYMSPEQARAARDIDTRSDIYSLGCTFFHAVCGRPPFEGKNPIVVIDQHMKAEPPAPSDLVPGLDLTFEAILLKCIEKDRARRFQSCAEVAHVIDRALGVAPAGPPPPPPPPPEVASAGTSGAGAQAPDVSTGSPGAAPRRATAPRAQERRSAATGVKVVVGVLVAAAFALTGYLAWLIITKGP